MQSTKEGVVHESAEDSSRPAVVTIGRQRSGFSVEPKLRFITEPKRRGLKTTVGCRKRALSFCEGLPRVEDSTTTAKHAQAWTRW